MTSAPDTARPTSLSTRRVAAIAAALLVVSLGLRLVGVGHGLPHRGEPDTYIVHQAETLLLDGLTDRYRAGWKYPHLVATVVAAVPADEITRPLDGAPLEEHQRAATALHLRTRTVVAVLSALAAPATFLIALRFLPLAWAAAAGFLVAASLLHVCFSVQARPHGPVSAFAALALLAALRWAERPTLLRALALAVGSACAVGSLHTGFAVLAPITVAGITALRRPDFRRAHVIAGLLLVGAVVAASTAWFYVRAEDGFGKDPTKTAAAQAQKRGGLGSDELNELARPGRTVETAFEGRRVLQFSGHVVPLDLFDGGGFGVAWWTLRTYDPLLLGFGLLGIAAALARARSGLRRSPVWIVLGFALPTLLLYGLYARSTDRFLLILVPMVALAAATGLRFAATRVPRVGGAAAGLALLAVFAGGANAARLRTLPDTTQQAVRWMEVHVDPEASVHVTNLRSIPLFMRPRDLRADMVWAHGPWEGYQCALKRPRARSVRGEREVPTEPTLEGPRRLGRPLVYPSTADQYRMALSDDRAAVATEILDEAAPDRAILSVHPALHAGPVDNWIVAKGWRAPLQEEPWRLVQRIENGLPDELPALEYRLDFFKVLRARAYGATLEIYAAVRD
ncbi:MAG: hypothetical protein AAGB93_23300 [Planctomycetota bacterium]